MLTLEAVHRQARARAASVALAWEGAPGRARAAADAAEAEGYAKPVLAGLDEARAHLEAGRVGAVVAPVEDGARLGVGDAVRVAAVRVGERVLLVGPVAGESQEDARAVAAQHATRVLARLGVEAAVGLVGDDRAEDAEASVRGLGLKARAYAPDAARALDRSDVLLLPTGVLGDFVHRLVCATDGARPFALLPAAEAGVVLMPEGADPVEAVALAGALARQARRA